MKPELFGQMGQIVGDNLDVVIINEQIKIDHIGYVTGDRVLDIDSIKPINMGMHYQLSIATVTECAVLCIENPAVL